MTSIIVSRTLGIRSGVAVLNRDIFIDNESDRGYIRGQIHKLAKEAQASGVAIGIGHDRPVTISVLTEMIPELIKQGYVFVNLSEVLEKQGHIPFIVENIANNLNNYTRFLILSKKTSSETSTDKTSIIFSIKDEPGSLYRIIENFHKNSVNLTKIESRPTKENTWEYNFYVDFEGHEKNPQVSEMLDNIKNESLFMKVLGSYPSAKLNQNPLGFLNEKPILNPMITIPDVITMISKVNPIGLGVCSVTAVISNSLLPVF